MKNKLDIEKYGPWALVTGASSGIGKALASELAGRGMKLLLAGRNEKRLKEVATDISQKFGVEVNTVIADLGSDAGVKALIDASRTYQIGLFIHSAGVESHGSLHETLLEREAHLIDINIKSTLQLTQHFASEFVSRGKGGILLVSSLTAHMTSPFLSNYAASKSYVLSFGRSLREELAGKGVDVSVLSPGLTQTPMFDQMGKDVDWSQMPVKVMSAEEVASEAIEQFPRKASVIPGKANRITAFIASRLLPSAFGRQNASMMKKAFASS